MRVRLAHNPGMLNRAAPLLPLLLLVFWPLGWYAEEAWSLATRQAPFVLERRCLDWHTTPRTTVCGRLYVHERRSASDSRVISMPFVVMRAPPDGRNPDPVILIDGGPGGPSWSAARPDDDWHWVYSHYTWLQDRDFVMLNQRGVGPRAEPSLDCPESYGLLEQVFELEPWRVAARACRARLEAAGVPLGAYNTTAIADDHIELLRTLGYDSYNIWGPSYGSRVAQVMLRRDTAAIRAAILEGAFPLDAPDDWQWERYFAEAVYRLLDSCQSRSACDEAYPDLRQQMNEVLTALHDNPVDVTVALPDSGRAVTYRIDDRAFLDMLNDALYGRNWLSQLPIILHRMKKDDMREAELTRLLENYLSNTVGGYSGEAMASVINCTERGRVPGPETIDAWVRLYPALGRWFRWRFSEDGCEDWPAESLRPLNRTPVTVRTPVLVLGGRYDFATPPEWSVRVASKLPNARLYLFTTGHYVSDEDCARRIMTRFIENPHESTGPECNVSPPLLFELPG